MLPGRVSQAFAKASLAPAAARAAAVAVAAAAASPEAAVAVRAAAASLAAASSFSKGGKNAIFVGFQKGRSSLGKRILDSVRPSGPWCFVAGKCFACVAKARLAAAAARAAAVAVAAAAASAAAA